MTVIPYLEELHRVHEDGSESSHSDHLFAHHEMQGKHSVRMKNFFHKIKLENRKKSRMNIMR